MANTKTEKKMYLIFRCCLGVSILKMEQWQSDW